MGNPESEDAELERGKALMKGDTLVIRFCLYGFLKSESVSRWQSHRYSIKSCAGSMQRSCGRVAEL